LKLFNRASADTRYRLALGLLAVTVSVLLTYQSLTALPTGSRLLFTEDFGDVHLNANKWETCYPWSHDDGCTNKDNNELEWYLPEQVCVHDGMLSLTAAHHPVLGLDPNGETKEFPYRSGMVVTAHHFEFTYGRVEFRARVPRGRGLWPTLWLLPADQSWPPEIDVMEAHGESNWGVLLAYHRTRTDTRQTLAIVGDISRDWHTYTLDWRSASLTWYIDGHPMFAFVGDVPRKRMYLIANLAVDGSSGHAPDATTPSSAHFDIAHVRVWSL
jgi:beta-glucanase (GH16 family)